MSERMPRIYGFPAQPNGPQSDGTRDHIDDAFERIGIESDAACDAIRKILERHHHQGDDDATARGYQNPIVTTQHVCEAHS
jgi:hypothetical protein